MKNLRTLMDNKAQQKTLFALLLSAGFVVSPAFVFANPEPIPVTQENQQSKVNVSGTVIDATGLPVIGASVVEKGSSNNGTITDLDGNFTLSVASGAVLEISFIGFRRIDKTFRNYYTLIFFIQNGMADKRAAHHVSNHRP